MLQAYTPRSSGHWVKRKDSITKLTTPSALVSKDKPSPRVVKQVAETQAAAPKDPNDSMKNSALAVASVFNWFASESVAPAPGPKAQANAAAVAAPAQPAEMPLPPFDLQDIPAALESQGFVLAAKLMRKWFAAAPYRLGSMVTPPPDAVDSATVKLKEIRKFPRIEEAYKKLMDEVVISPAAQARLQAIVQGLAESAASVDNSALLETNLLKVHRECMFAHIAVGKALPGNCTDIQNGVNNSSQNLTDDLDMALGQVFLCAAVNSVRFTRTSTETRAYVKELAVYMLAPYHFSMGPRYRGHWNKKQVALISDGADFVGCPVYEGKDKHAKNAVLRPVTDDDFNQWRDKHQSGGDMLVLSDAARRTYEKEFWFYDEQEEGFSVALTPLELSAVLTGGTIERSSTGTRLWGALAMVGGAMEMVGGGALLGAPEPVLTKVAGAVFLAHGSDTLTTGWKQVLSGHDQVSYTQEAATQTAATFGASAPMALAIGMSVDMGIGILDGNAVKALRLTGVKNGLISVAVEDSFKGAHIVAKHIGKDEAFLRSRLVGTTMKAATSFKNEHEAATAISTVIKGNMGPIQTWVKSGVPPFSEFSAILGYPVGYGVVRATGQMQQGFTKVVVRLKRTQIQGRDFFILTAFPTL